MPAMGKLLPQILGRRTTTADLLDEDVIRVRAAAQDRYTKYVESYSEQRNGGRLTPRQLRRLRKKDRVILKRAN